MPGQPAKFLPHVATSVIDLLDIKFTKIFYAHHWKDPRAEKNPTIYKIVLLWLLTKTILNDSYYRWTCASNHFITVRFVLNKGSTISYVVTGPRQYSRNLEKLYSVISSVATYIC